MGSEPLQFADPFQSIVGELGSAPPPVSGLELETLPPATPAAGKAGPWTKARNEDLEAVTLGGFGKAEQGTIESIKYWIKVKQRLKELDIESQKAIRTSKTKADKLLKLRAELGRRAHEMKLPDEEIRKLIEKALKVEGASKGRLGPEQRVQAESAWAEVGDRISGANIETPELKSLKSQVEEARQSAAEAERKVELFNKARESYDRDVVDEAKRLVKVWTIGLAAVFIVVLFFVLIS